ncbi:transcription factor atoh8 [Entelurus aequoreus]|uniref:transcription factor atoh8 n=1 Tax=Entelurus aequoreus TaxID=161455 RepID=UPI002B1E0D7A|nr:transcription factor atoh8 [Entelurus aequoreus]XP_061899662.1 transcription factor atoh8 [Entelurus aequoreus]XP_061899663.1 transcription factor atoh8 [Entelurus aequoreus]
MKDPHPLTNNWIDSTSKDPVLLSMQSSHKKFKRKSREPKKLFSSCEPDSMKSYAVDTTESNTLEDCSVRRLAPLHRHLIVSQESTGALSGVMAVPPQSGAIDMRIGSAVTSKLSQPPTSTFSNPEIVHWPSAISQPLSNRFKLGARSNFPITTLANQHTFSLDPAVSLPGQSTAPPLSANSQGHECVIEHQEHTPEESLTQQVGMTPDGAPRFPEVKAIQQTRRLLANARERTRVHTISAAFEALRKQVPCYSYGQKLSKLAILRIACNYILSLAQLAELDYSSDHNSQSFSQCVEQCTRTLQAEGRSKKRKVGRMTEDE